MSVTLSPTSGTAVGSILSQLDSGLVGSSEEVLSERAAATPVARSGTSAASGATDVSASANEDQVTVSQAAGFSFSVAFHQFFAQTVSAAAGGMDSLLGQLDSLYQDLLSYDPKQAEMLGLVAQMLMAVDPEAAESILGRMHDVLSRARDLRSGAARAASAGQSAQAQAVAGSASSANATPQSQTVTQTVHFSFDFNVQMTSEVRTAVAQLRGSGVEVQTTQSQTSASVSIHIEYTAVRQEVRRSDPLVVDLGGDGVTLTSAANGVSFDIDADGTADRTAFVQGNDAFLALDRNGNGTIDSGAELFGDQHGAANGFEELARYDGNGDGRIDSADAVFGQLRLLHDKNGDGRVDPNELSSLLEAGVSSIALEYRTGQTRDDGAGNLLAERSAYTRPDGSQGLLVDAWVGYV